MGWLGILSRVTAVLHGDVWKYRTLHFKHILDHNSVCLETVLFWQATSTPAAAGGRESAQRCWMVAYVIIEQVPHCNCLWSHINKRYDTRRFEIVSWRGKAGVVAWDQCFPPFQLSYANTSRSYCASGPAGMERYWYSWLILEKTVE